MAATDPIHIGDKAGDERSQARAISELLVRLGAVEGRLHATDALVETLRARVESYAAELDTALHSVRAVGGRASRAAERVRLAQDELAESVLKIRNELRNRDG